MSYYNDLQKVNPVLTTCEAVRCIIAHIIDDASVKDTIIECSAQALGTYYIGTPYVMGAVAGGLDYFLANDA